MARVALLTPCSGACMHVQVRAPRRRFLLYANSNCVDHREKAFDALVQLSKEIGIPPPDAVGRCHGSHPELSLDASTLEALVADGNNISGGSGGGNARLAQHYRFVVSGRRTAWVLDWPGDVVLGLVCLTCSPVFSSHRSRWRTAFFRIMSPRN